MRRPRGGAPAADGADRLPPRRRWGQNFLVNPSFAARIVEAAGLAAGEAVLEIGPGDGALTLLLAETGARVAAVEIDARRAERLAGRLARFPEVRLLVGDVLDREFREWLALGKIAPPAVLVANLPYNVATPVLRKAMEAEGCFSRLVVTVQREVARRLVARPGDPEYGYLSVVREISASGEILFDIPPGAFRPAPRVTSSVVRIVPRFSGLPTERRARLLRLVSLAFSARRKTLANALGASLGVENARRWVAAAGLPAAIRAEQVPLSRFIALLDEWEEHDARRA